MTRPALTLNVTDDEDRDEYVPDRAVGVLTEVEPDAEPPPVDGLEPAKGQPYVRANIGVWYAQHSIVLRATPETTNPRWWADRYPRQDVVLEVSRGGWATPDACPAVVARWQPGDALPGSVVLETPAEVVLVTDVGPTLATRMGDLQGRPAYRIAPTGWMRLVVRQLARWSEKQLKEALKLEERRAGRRAVDAALRVMRRVAGGGEL